MKAGRNPAGQIAEVAQDTLSQERPLQEPCIGNQGREDSRRWMPLFLPVSLVRKNSIISRYGGSNEIEAASVRHVAKSKRRLFRSPWKAGTSG